MKFNLRNKLELKSGICLHSAAAVNWLYLSFHNQLYFIGTSWWVGGPKVLIALKSDPMQTGHDWQFTICTTCMCIDLTVYVHDVWNCVCVPLTMDIDLPEPRHFALSSSRTAGLHERLHDRLEERLGMGCGGPSLELCTASYRLSIDPSWPHVDRHTAVRRDLWAWST